MKEEERRKRESCSSTHSDCLPVLMGFVMKWCQIGGILNYLDWNDLLREIILDKLGNIMWYDFTN